MKKIAFPLAIAAVFAGVQAAQAAIDPMQELFRIEQSCPGQMKRGGTYTLSGDQGHKGKETLRAIVKGMNRRLVVSHKSKGVVWDNSGATFDAQGSWAWVDVDQGFPGRELVILGNVHYDPPFEPNMEGGHNGMDMTVLAFNPLLGEYTAQAHKPRVLELITPYRPCTSGGSLSTEGAMAVMNAVRNSLKGRGGHFLAPGKSLEEAVWHYNLAGDNWDDTFADVKSAQGPFPAGRLVVKAQAGAWTTAQTHGREGMEGMSSVYLIKKLADGYHVFAAVDHESGPILPPGSPNRWGLDAGTLKKLGWQRSFLPD